MRRLGVYSENLPTKRERTVVASDFSIGGLVGNFPRKYAKAFQVRSAQEALAIFGGQESQSAYGWDALNGFLANLAGTEGSLYIDSYPGSSSAAASVSLNNTDSAAEPILKLSAAYQTEPELALNGNRTGYTVLNGVAFSSAVTTLPTGSGAPARVITLESVVGFKVGDIIKLSKTGFSEFHFVTAVNENAKTVTWADADYAGTGTAADYTAGVAALQVRTYRKDLKGVVTEVESSIGDTWVTFNALDPDRYVENVFAANSWMDAALLTVTGAPTATQTLPVDVATVAFLSGGLDGTMPANAGDWNLVYADFDNLPVRFMANCETAVAANQAALEAYCRARSDNPVAILVGQMDMTKAQAIAAGQVFQRSDEVDAIFVHNWFEVQDPFASSPSAPARQVPNVGHLMGFAISGIQTLGIHCIPARKSRSIYGVSGVVGEQALSDFDRTDLAVAGVNVAQEITGRGVVVRNWFTPSTAPEFKFGNAVVMRNYIKLSATDSLQESENTPNDIGHVREDRMAILQFLIKMWSRGSNGNIAEGETFGQYEKLDGTVSTREDAFEVVADARNNSIATLAAGERNLDCWFMYPAPAGSIKIGVGIIYKVSD